MEIYKIQHQLWIGGASIPKELRKYSKINKNLNPDWRYELWNDIKIEALMNEHGYDRTYNEFIYMHQKIDFAKYVILYCYGGIYLDFDSYCMKSLNGLIEENIKYDLILSKLNCNMMENYLHCNHHYCVNNGIIYAKPKNKILKLLIDKIVSNHHCIDQISKMVCIEQTTGPTRLTDIIVEHLDDTVKLLEPEYLEPCILDVCHITKNTYVVHKHNGTWFSPQTKQIFTLYMNYKNPIYALFIILVIIMTMFILYYKGYIYN